METARDCRGFRFHESNETPAVPCVDRRAAFSDDTLRRIFFGGQRSAPLAVRVVNEGPQRKCKSQAFFACLKTAKPHMAASPAGRLLSSRAQCWCCLRAAHSPITANCGRREFTGSPCSCGVRESSVSSTECST